jgi:bla regulator protein blaR1
MIIALFLIVAYMQNSKNVNTANNEKGSTEKKVGVSSPVTPKDTKEESGVIVYNSHPQEKYKYGDTVIDISKSLIEKLNNKRVKCEFLENTNTDYKEAYSYARKLVINSVPDYKTKILLDIHRMSNMDKLYNDITITIGKGNTNYQKNKEFATKLLQEINSVDKGISTEIIELEYKYNQDLSDKAVILEIGNESKAKEMVNNCLNALTLALKKVN